MSQENMLVLESPVYGPFPYCPPLFNITLGQTQNFQEWFEGWNTAGDDHGARMGRLHELGTRNIFWSYKEKDYQYTVEFLLHLADGYCKPPRSFFRDAESREMGRLRKEMSRKAMLILVKRIFEPAITSHEGFWNCWRGIFTNERILQYLVWFFRFSHPYGFHNLPQKGLYDSNDKEMVVVQKFIVSFARLPWNFLVEHPWMGTPQQLETLKSFFDSNRKMFLEILEYFQEILPIFSPTQRFNPIDEVTLRYLSEIAYSTPNQFKDGVRNPRTAQELIAPGGSQSGWIVFTEEARRVRVDGEAQQP